MIGWLTEPFAFAFMQKALVASVIVGVVCAVIGCYIVLRSMAFLGDALAHAILPGVAVAYLVGVNLLAGALVAGVLVAVGISYVSRAGTIKEDTAIGIFFAAALALGVVLISTMHTYAVDLTHVLFGNVLGVTAADLWVTGGAGAGGAGGHRCCSTSSCWWSRSTPSSGRRWGCTPTRCAPACSSCWPPPSWWRCGPSAWPWWPRCW